MTCDEAATGLHNRAEEIHRLPSSFSDTQRQVPLPCPRRIHGENVDRLIEDLRGQILPLDAVFVHRTVFGEIYRIAGPLLGPSGRQIFIVSVWLKHALSGTVHFVTLIPQPQTNA